MPRKKKKRKRQHHSSSESDAVVEIRIVNFRKSFSVRLPGRRRQSSNNDRLLRPRNLHGDSRRCRVSSRRYSRSSVDIPNPSIRSVGDMIRWPSSPKQPIQIGTDAPVGLTGYPLLGKRKKSARRSVADALDCGEGTITAYPALLGRTLFALRGFG